MKKLFVEPELEVLMLHFEDIMNASSGDVGRPPEIELPGMS